MTTSDYVVVKAGRSGASFLRQNVSEAAAWGEFYVMSAIVWQETVLTNSFKELKGQDKTGWKDIDFVGYASEGVWLKGASMTDILRVTNTVHSVRGLHHISATAYADLRRRAPIWWKKAFEQRGWDMIPPVTLQWQRCNEPTPEEVKQYMKLLAAKGWETKIPSEAKTFSVLNERCDPDGKLMALAKAKYK